MNFLTMRQEVGEQLHIDITNSDIKTLVNRWINLTQQDITSRYSWHFLKSREVVRTVTDKTAGTVTVNANATVVTGSSTSFGSEDVGKFIQFQNNNDWYEITSVASATSLTMTTAFNPTTNLSAGTYTIRQFFYSLSSSADRILDIRVWNTPLKLHETDFRTFHEVRPNPSSTGAPRVFIPLGQDSSRNLRFGLYPNPDTRLNLEVLYLQRLSDLSADADTSSIPVKWHHVVVDGAVYRGYGWQAKQDLSSFWKTRYEEGIELMKRSEPQSLDDFPILRAIDSYESSRFLRFPESYPITR